MIGIEPGRRGGGGHEEEKEGKHSFLLSFFFSHRKSWQDPPAAQTPKRSPERVGIRTRRGKGREAGDALLCRATPRQEGPPKMPAHLSRSTPFSPLSLIFLPVFPPLVLCSGLSLFIARIMTRSSTALALVAALALMAGAVVAQQAAAPAPALLGGHHNNKIEIFNHTPCSLTVTLMFSNGDEVPTTLNPRITEAVPSWTNVTPGTNANRLLKGVSIMTSGACGATIKEWPGDTGAGPVNENKLKVSIFNGNTKVHT